jgi:uncharacterized protein with ParB-like and HNH nuclease domain
MNEPPKLYSVKEIFSSDIYIIPIYQRNYAWGETEIIQLIQDIVDYYKKDKSQNYYIGTLVVWERKLTGERCFETIDGQQRLTTLSILLSMIKNEYSQNEESNIDLSWYKLNLKFDCRKKSNKTLEACFFGNKENNNEFNPSIIQAYEDVKKALSKILNEANLSADIQLSIDGFCSYLLDRVSILRVTVPEDTDLNRYFEIMNSRGEQLEKHEKLKAQFLKALDEADRYSFNLIWEACSNMEKYVQYGFTKKNNIRDNIFGSEWNEIIISQNDIYTELKPDKETSNNEKIDISIKELLKEKTKQYGEKIPIDNDDPDRFNTIINFPNFLLHILRIQTKSDIPLDDKRLLDTFKPFLKDEGSKKEFAKTFGYNLLKGKFLFDKYIIKREFTKGTDHWSLKRLKWDAQQETCSYINTFGGEENIDDINREILMLLSMFHVSAPTQVYKHWLNSALKFVFENENEEAITEKYKNYLEDLAESFLHKRYLSSTPADYFNIIYGSERVTRTDYIKHIDEEKNKLDSGTSVENFIFNYLDYLLWKDYRRDKKYFKIENEKSFTDERITNFEFTFRSSVEHYYPQSPIENSMKLQGEDEKWLDNFGNLCLISSSKNSRLSNHMPNAKKDYYDHSPTIDSIKQRIMMEYKHWDTSGANSKNEIEEHGNMMKKILLQNG